MSGGKKVVVGIRTFGKASPAEWVAVLLAQTGGDRFEEIAFVTGIAAGAAEAEVRAAHQLAKLGLRVKRFMRFESEAWR